MECSPGRAVVPSLCPRALSSSLVISANSSLPRSGTVEAGADAVEVFLHGLCYAAIAALARVSAEDGFGADGWQSYSETFGKYPGCSMRSQSYSTGSITPPGKLILPLISFT